MVCHQVPSFAQLNSSEAAISPGWLSGVRMRWTFEDHLLVARERAGMERSLGGGVGPWLDYLPLAQHLRVARSAATATGQPQPSAQFGKMPSPRIRPESLATYLNYL